MKKDFLFNFLSIFWSKLVRNLNNFWLIFFGNKIFGILKPIDKLTDKIKFEHLSKLSLWLVFSLPFERIPSINLGVNLRISQLLTIISLVFIIILVLKKDRQILQFKIQKPFIWLVLFYFFAIPSIFFVQDFGRFITTSIATFLVFCACFLVAHFTKSVWQSLRYLLISTTISGIFGIYQFLGDFLDFPIILTGLRPQYTKAVFGYPRIQATAIEPLYFAGMLFLPLFFWILILLNRECKEFLSQEFAKIWRKLQNQIDNIFIKIKLKTQQIKSQFGKKVKKEIQIENQNQIQSKNSQYFLKVFATFSPIFTFKQKLQAQIQNIFPFYNFEIISWFFLAFFSFLFLFTLSKSGWLCFLVILFPLLFCYRSRLNFSFWQNLGKFVLFLGFFLFICNLNPNFNRVFGGTLNHFMETLSGESGTITERKDRKSVV